MKHAVMACVLVIVALAGPAATAAAEDALGRETPRGTMHGYLQATREADYRRAMEYLDLRRFPRAERDVQGPRLARELRIVLDQKLWVVPDTLSDDPLGNPDDGLGPGLERVGKIQTSRGVVDVLLERVPGGNGAPLWKVAASTVAQVPVLSQEFGYGVLGEFLPPPLFELRFLEVALWQWIGLLGLILLAAVASWLIVIALTHVLGPVAARLGWGMHVKLIPAITGPARLATALAVFTTGALGLGLAVPVHAFLAGVVKALVIITLAWLLIRLTDLMAAVARERLTIAGRTAAIGMVPLGTKVVKVFLLTLTGLAVLQNLGINVTGVLAGLGIGGLAIALAAQKTVENLFGGVSLIVDQPVRVGDFCRFGNKLGTIEEIGLRSTRVRTLDRTVIAVPNAEFSSLQLENFARRDKVWFSAQLGLRYETTPDQLRWILVELRKLLYAHPRVDPDPARVRFVGFGAYSLDLEIFAYVTTTDFGEFLAIRQDIYLRIMDVVAASGTGFAFPSQTTYLGRDGGRDAARSEKAEAEVQAWRERGELYLPDFPPEAIASLSATLPYPPSGAAAMPRT
jgi:MscS family membrane protein